MCSILISAAILLVLVKLVASDSDPEFWPMAGVALIVMLASLAGDQLLTDFLGGFGGLLGILALPPALIWICGVTLKQALAITGLYVVVQVVLIVLLALIFGAALMPAN